VVINASATQEMYALAGTRALAAGAAAGSLAVGPSAVGSIALTMPPPVGLSEHSADNGSTKKADPHLFRVILMASTPLPGAAGAPSSVCRRRGAGCHLLFLADSRRFHRRDQIASALVRCEINYTVADRGEIIRLG
jgi:hypothetical protein